MKRTITIILLITVCIHPCCHAQLKAIVGISATDAYISTPVYFNLSEIASVLCTDKATLAKDIHNWREGNYVGIGHYDCPVRLVCDNTPDQYDNECLGQYWLTPDGRASQWQNDESKWTCSFVAYAQYNLLELDVTIKPNTSKNGDQYHALFALVREGRSLTIDMTIIISDHTYANRKNIGDLTEVGKDEIDYTCIINDKYQSMPINLEQIAHRFSLDNVETTNIELYYMEDDSNHLLYHSPNNDICVKGDTSDKSLYIRLDNMPEEQIITANYANANIQNGDKRSVALYLVAGNEYYKIDLNLNFTERITEQEKYDEYISSCKVVQSLECIFTLSPQDYFTTGLAKFNLTDIANMLGMTKKQLCDAFKTWQNNNIGNNTDYGREMLINLRDAGKIQQTGSTRASYWLQPDGKSVNWTDETSAWSVLFTVYEDENILTVEAGLKPAGTNEDLDCNTQIALNNNGKLVVFEISLQTEDDSRANLIPKSLLTKIGEVKVCGEDDDNDGVIKLNINMDKILDMYTAHGLTPYNIMFCINSMDTPQSLTDKYSHYLVSTVNMTIDGYDNQSGNKSQSYYLTYDPADGGQLYAKYSLLDFSGGERSSGSVFLVNDNEFVELTLDIQFSGGLENHDLAKYNVIESIRQDVTLNVTGSFFTSFGLDALVQTPIDIEHIRQILDIDVPYLYAEIDHEGNTALTCTYTATPGQAFWLMDNNGHMRVATYSDNPLLGVYYSDSSFKWYENPAKAKVGDVCIVCLYLVNKETNDAVMYEFTVRFNNDYTIDNPYYITRLPQFITDSKTTSIDMQTHNPSSDSNYSHIYNLQGQRRTTLQRGINIVMGRKVLIK